MGTWYSEDDRDLQFYMESMIDMHSQDRNAYWSEGPDRKIQFEQAERFGALVKNASDTLVHAGPTEHDLQALDYEVAKSSKEMQNEYGRKLQELIPQLMNMSNDERLAALKKLNDELSPSDPDDKDSPLRLTWERLFIDAAWDSISRIRNCASRRFELYNLRLVARPSRPTLPFLARVCECYLWGLDSECVVMCRSVLDTAFRETVTNAMCSEHLGPRKYEFTMSERIRSAHKAGIIDDATKDRALIIKERGDKSIHYQPNITKDVLGTINDTICVLNALLGKGIVR
jgi:hypothetical protein